MNANVLDCRADHSAIDPIDTMIVNHAFEGDGRLLLAEWWIKKVVAHSQTNRIYDGGHTCIWFQCH